MKYFYIITINSGVQGGTMSVTDTIAPDPQDDRMTLFWKIYSEVCKRLGWEIDKTAVAYFYLEPLELEKA